MSDAKPTVSVVMPVYNAEPFLREAVASILNQTWQDFEFIIIDDGSSDNSRAILGSLQDPRLRLVFCEHAGFLPTLTRAVYEARGDWIARMDADDICHPERLERQLDFLHSHPECVFVGCTYGLITPNGKYLRPRGSFKWEYVDRRRITLGGRSADASVAFHREKALAVGLYDPEFENEKPLWYRMLELGKGAVLGEPLYFARWLFGSHNRNDFLKRRAWHIQIRERYDPVHAAQLNLPLATDLKSATIRTAARGVNYYLLARDLEAARNLAWTIWKKWPLDVSTVKILVKSTLGIRNSRHLLVQNEHSYYISTDTPW